jgi:hypothetical protein
LDHIQPIHLHTRRPDRSLWCSWPLNYCISKNHVNFAFRLLISCLFFYCSSTVFHPSTLSLSLSLSLSLLQFDSIRTLNSLCLRRFLTCGSVYLAAFRFRFLHSNPFASKSFTINFPFHPRLFGRLLGSLDARLVPLLHVLYLPFKSRCFFPCPFKRTLPSTRNVLVWSLSILCLLSLSRVHL